MKWLLLFLLFPSLAFGLDVILQIDGQTIRTIDANRVNVITNDQRQLIDVRTKPKSDPKPPPVDPPKPPPPSNCSLHPPANVSISAINWRQPRGETRHALGSNILAFQIVTTESTVYEGQIATTYSSTNPTYRTVWISQCAGDPIDDAIQNCVGSGYESAIIRWTQNPNSRNPCKLDRNTTYFINVQNVDRDTGASTCPSNNCPFHMNIYTNQKS